MKEDLYSSSSSFTLRNFVKHGRPAYLLSLVCVKFNVDIDVYSKVLAHSADHEHFKLHAIGVGGNTYSN